MQLFVIYNSQNTAGHGKDATGAFIPEALNFKKYRESKGDTVELVPFDNLLAPAKRPAAFLDAISKAKPFDGFVYLGHGLRNSMSSAQITQAKRPDFTKLLMAKATGKHLFVTLYACSTGETTTGGADGEGGFADKVRDDLVAAGFGGWVDGHTVPGHATQNSRVRRFECKPELATKGGEWLVEPGTPEFKRWQARLNSKWRDDPFRFDFPYMDLAAIRAACK